MTSLLRRSVVALVGALGVAIGAALTLAALATTANAASCGNGPGGFDAWVCRL